MAAEVLCQRYLASRPDVAQTGEQELAMLTVLNDTINPGLPFEHNPIHDVESLFWLAVFMMLFYRDISSAKETDEDKRDRMACREFVCSDNILVSKDNRNSIIFCQQDFRKWVNWICGSFKQLVNPLYTLNVGLCKVYTAFEESMQTEKNVTIPLAAHKTASAMFQICMRESHNIRIESNKDRAKVALPVPNRNLKTNRINDPLCPLPAIDHQSESSLARLL